MSKMDRFQPTVTTAELGNVLADVEEAIAHTGCVLNEAKACRRYLKDVHKQVTALWKREEARVKAVQKAEKNQKLYERTREKAHNATYD